MKDELRANVVCVSTRAKNDMGVREERWEAPHRPEGHTLPLQGGNGTDKVLH